MASWNRHHGSATQAIVHRCLDWCTLQEVRLGPRQACGARARMLQGGCGRVSFASLPAVPAPPTRAGPRKRVQRNGGLAIATMHG
eukprot:407875-Alexandrium_andersonii.AAC.1